MRELNTLNAPVRQDGLDQVVNREMRMMSRTLPRDTFDRDCSRLCQRIIRALPAKLRKALGEDALRNPYSAHCALAILDSTECQELHDEFSEAFRGNVRDLAPRVSREQRKIPRALFGEEAVQDTIDWLAREFSARHRCYGTRGLYLRRYFLGQCARFRAALDLDYQPHKEWERIVTHLIEAGALQVTAYHRSGDHNYPSFSFVGSGRRYVHE